MSICALTDRVCDGNNGSESLQKWLYLVMLTALILWVTNILIIIDIEQNGPEQLLPDSSNNLLA